MLLLPGSGVHGAPLQLGSFSGTGTVSLQCAIEMATERVARMLGPEQAEANRATLTGGCIPKNSFCPCPQHVQLCQHTVGLQ